MGLFLLVLLLVIVLDQNSSYKRETDYEQHFIEHELEHELELDSESSSLNPQASLLL